MDIGFFLRPKGGDLVLPRMSLRGNTVPTAPEVNTNPFLIFAQEVEDHHRFLIFGYRLRLKMFFGTAFCKICFAAFISGGL